MYGIYIYFFYEIIIKKYWYVKYLHNYNQKNAHMYNRIKFRIYNAETCCLKVNCIKYTV